MPAKPKTIIAQVDNSGTAATVASPSRIWRTSPIPPPEIATEKEAIVSLLMPWNPKKLDPVPREMPVPVPSNVKVRLPLSTKVKMAVVSASAPPEFEVVEGVAARETERQCL